MHLICQLNDESTSTMLQLAFSNNLFHIHCIFFLVRETIYIKGICFFLSSCIIHFQMIKGALKWIGHWLNVIKNYIGIDELPVFLGIFKFTKHLKHFAFKYFSYKLTTTTTHCLPFMGLRNQVFHSAEQLVP